MYRGTSNVTDLPEQNSYSFRLLRLRSHSKPPQTAVCPLSSFVHSLPRLYSVRGPFLEQFTSLAAFLVGKISTHSEDFSEFCSQRKEQTKKRRSFFSLEKPNKTSEAPNERNSFEAKFPHGTLTEMRQTSAKCLILICISSKTQHSKAVASYRPRSSSLRFASISQQSVPVAGLSC